MTFFTCSCGKAYTRQAWDTLPKGKRYVDMFGAFLEQKVCVCGSHGTAALIRAATCDDMIAASTMFSETPIAFQRRFTALEAIHLFVVFCSTKHPKPSENAKVYGLVSIVNWTDQQIRQALHDGIVPEWEMKPGITRRFPHALNVTDCGCYVCESKRRLDEPLTPAERLTSDAMSEVRVLRPGRVDNDT